MVGVLQVMHDPVQQLVTKMCGGCIFEGAGDYTTDFQ